MKIIYFDCFSGISGDMVLGAFIDAGLDRKVLEELPVKLNLPQVKIGIKKEIKNGLSATKVDIDFPPNHSHRHLNEIEEIIRKGDLPETVKISAIKIFRKLAAAESKVHGIDISEVHFHEVGALDAIIDITGTALAFYILKIEKAYCGTISIGGGSVKISHGTYPVPAPATAYLLKDFQLQHGPLKKELVTPTGAAILASFCEKDSVPSYNLKSTGYGAGTAKFKEIPNVLRVFIGEYQKKENGYEKQDNVLLLECNIDDLNPQIYPYLLEQIMNIGAMDAFLTPILMKKGRPAHMLSVLCYPDKESQVLNIIFMETTTIGVRKQQIIRSVLKRTLQEIDTMYGMLQVKEIETPDGNIRIMAEFEDCKRIALKHGLPLREVQENLFFELNKNNEVSPL